MTTITEDYVSFEVAKLLKEKGFDVPVWTRYEDDNEVIFGDKYNWNNSPIGQTSAPTHQMAMKWLREVHGLSVETFSIKGTSNVFPVFWKGNVVKLLTQDRAFNGELVGSYEEAVEAALKYCLENLI